MKAISIHLRIVVIYRPPQSKQNYLTKSQFIDEFNEYLEGLAASSGRLLICGALVLLISTGLIQAVILVRSY